jgi:hypothetical protein
MTIEQTLQPTADLGEALEAFETVANMLSEFASSLTSDFEDEAETALMAERAIRDVIARFAVKVGPVLPTTEVSA